MCQHQEQTPRTDWQEEARQQANMYPNLEEFLNHLLPENQSQFLRDFFRNANGQSNNAQSGGQFNAQPSAPPAPENSRSDGQSNAQPSAPPAPENTQSNGQSTGQSNAQSGAQNSANHCGGWQCPSGNWGNWQNWQNWQNPTENRQNRRQQQQTYNHSREDDVSILLQRIGQTVAFNFAKVIGFISFMIPILMVPKFFLILGIFAAFMKSFGIPVTPLVLGGIAFEILTALDPILITLLAIWTIWKTVILRKPLVDVSYWRNRINSRCHQN